MASTMIKTILLTELIDDGGPNIFEIIREFEDADTDDTVIIACNFESANLRYIGIIIFQQSNSLIFSSNKVQSLSN